MPAAILWQRLAHSQARDCRSFDRRTSSRFASYRVAFNADAFDAKDAYVAMTRDSTSLVVLSSKPVMSFSAVSNLLKLMLTMVLGAPI